MSQLERLLSDARAAQARHNGPAASAALDALGQDVLVLRREGRLSDALASTLRVEVDQARARVALDIASGAPASSSPSRSSPASVAAPASTPAAQATPQAPAGGGDNGAPAGNGHGKDNAGNGDSGHGGGGGHGDGKGHGGG